MIVTLMCWSYLKGRQALIFSKFYLEDLLGAQVDLVTDKALRPQVRQAIEREMIHVA